MLNTEQKIRNCPVFLDGETFTVEIDGQVFTASSLKALASRVEAFYANPPIEAMTIPYSTGQEPRKIKLVRKGDKGEHMYELKADGKLSVLSSYEAFHFDQQLFDRLMELHKNALAIENEYSSLRHNAKQMKEY